MLVLGNIGVPTGLKNGRKKWGCMEVFLVGLVLAALTGQGFGERG